MDQTTTFKENFKVYVRVRPFLERELTKSCSFSIADVVQGGKELHIYEFIVAEIKSEAQIKDMLKNPKFYQIHQFEFDRTFDDKSNQEDVFTTTTKPAIDYLLKGYNGAIFAYGQTGTGKTHTIEGSTDSPGIMMRTVEDLLTKLQSWKKDSYKLCASYLQIYNETVSDLLVKPPDAKTLKKNLSSEGKGGLDIKKHKEKGVFVEGIKEVEIENVGHGYEIIRTGINNRVSASTNMNELSSRSHAVFTLSLHKKVDKNSVVISKLHLIDLAGSERITLTGVTGARLQETKNINMSLSELSNVIIALGKKKDSGDFIQYRNSKLTRLLEDSLGGNTFTAFIATISPAHESLSETLSTLKFAARAKNVKTTVSMNKTIKEKGHLKILEKYKNDLMKFKGMTAEELNFSDMDEEEAEELINSKLKNGKARPHSQIGKKGFKDDKHDRHGDNSAVPMHEDGVLELYKEMLMAQRDVLIEMTTKLNNKNMEILSLKRKLKEESGSNVAGNSNKVLLELKEGIDSIVDALSMKNESLDLQNIAETLLKLQSKCNKAIKNN